MSPCVGAGDGPAVLQLQKWDHLRFQLEPSEFCLASISPTRDLLLLLSYQFEALLFPLIFDKDESGKFYSEAILGPNPPEHASTQRPDPDCARYSNATEEIGKGTVFPNRGYALSSEHYPVISGVKSLAWGHCGDVHNQYEDSGFREILIVSGDNGIIIHAFRDPNRNEVFKSAPEYETVHGKWVEWGPTCREVKGFLHSRTYETSESVNVHGTVRDGVSSNKSILPKKWLQTFTTKLDTVVCNGKYLTRFPPKSSLHLSADVVSFDIYDSTFKFLEFFSSFTLHGKGNLRDGTVVGKVDGASFSDLPSEVSTEPGTGLVHYRCSRVFNNSSHNLIGLVLNFPENISGENTEAHIRNAGQNYVVVMMLNPWGLQWVCSVDLQDNYSCPGPSSEWADFQFLDDFLVCLNTSGLICMWGAKTGCLVARFDTLKSCGLDLKVCSGINEAMAYVNRDSAPTTMTFSQNVDHNDVRGRETCAGEIVCARTFRKLMVISHSFLLAVIDEQGVIYVICAAKYVLEKCGAVRSFAHPYNYSDCGMLAGCEIGRQKPLSDLSPCPGSYISTQFIRDSPYTKGSQRYNHSSEFSTFSHLNGLKISHPEHKITAAPLRKVFLPLNRYNKEDSVCFSPFGITRLVRSCSGKQPNNYKIVHTTLHVVSPVLDDRDLDVPCMSKCCSSSEEVIFSGDSIGCCFQGCLYLVTQDGLSVILPSVSVSSSFHPADFIRYWQPNTTATSGSQIKILLATDEFKELGMPWQIEVLDRTLLHEGPEEAERICLENGWDLKIARMRRLQLSLHYLKSDEIEKSLDMLVDVNLAEDGILCLLFTSVRRIFCKAGSDSEVALASRLLALAASFATKMVRKYWLEEHKKELLYDVKKDLGVSCVQLLLKKHVFDEISNSRRLYEMARFLEVIRILQSRQISKTRGLGQALAGGTEAANVGDADALQDGSLLPVAKMDSVSHGLLNTSEAQAKIESSQTSSEPAFDSSKQLALLPKESADGEANLHEFNDADIVHRKKTISLENPTYMIARWGLDNLDLKAIVKDALDSGRLPLAVLQLHLLRRKELVSANKPHDIFNEISEIGRAIAYDLFLKGESELAVSTLLRLGEDVEVILRELLFGTVRRSLRKQIAEATKKYGNLRPHEWKTLERISVIERLYPSCSFWKTFLERQKDNLGDSSSFTSPAANNLKLNFCVHDNLTIECGDIDGVVADSWINVGGGSPEVCEDSPHAAYYWACAAIWCDAWDQRIVDRILLDQPCHEDVHAAWESQFDYHMSHNGWEKVFKLLDVIPTSMLSEGSLEINLNSSPSAANMSTNFPYHAMYICADGEELEPMFMDVPDVRIFRSSTVSTCSSWLKMLVEQELAKKFIFLKEYWESTAEIMPLLVRAGLIIDACKISLKDEPSMNSLDLTVLDMGSKPHKDAGEALHKLVVHYCTQYNLPNLLDLYIDHCNLVHDDDSFSPFLNAAGDCQWAKWLLFSRIKGHEYEASLSNARSNLSRQMVLGGNLSVLEIDEIIHTVDDMAEGGGEMAALATLMYAAAPLQECVCAGSVNRHCSFSSQCTLENLRPTLQHFPTLWRTLVNACFGQDDNNCSLNSNTANVFGNSALSDYLKWRDTIFSSSGGDTSLIQMLPCWFPKSIRRLVTLLFQGPLGLQFLSGSVPCGQSSFYRENAYAISTTGNAGFSPINWEAAIQRSIEELYSSLEDKGFGVEHYLHRGRALAAFNHILGIRASKLKSNHVHKELSGQNIQSDLQAILAPMSESEVSPLSSVIPLAIMHFEDSVLVASCTFLLELCGLPANLLRVDVAVLQRISSYYNSIGHNAQLGHISPRGSSIHAGSYESDITLSVVQALADNHIHHDHLNILDQRRDSCKFSKGKQSPHSLITVLQHLEKSSLPLIEEGKTCGFWLSCGCGDGYEFRSQQKDASLQWKLVTAFCQMHHLPLSTKYLALLASDNDWVGFLTEAQMGGFSNDIIIEVAAKEFKDPRLKTHVLTVLKSVQSARKNTNSSSTNGLAPGRDEMPPAPDSKTMVPMELFGLLADCERQKYPGEALLTKAKDLRWPLLAMIASCFSDVSPLSCMIVWLEITTARETSSIKVNDISSKIANNIRAAVEATNKLPSGSRNLVFRYNRRNPKRRRLMEHASGESRVNGSFDNPGIPSSMAASIPQEIGTEERNEMFIEKSKISIDSDEGLECLSNMTAVLCEQHLFHPLLRAFEMFLPSCSLLPFVRSLQAFSQMRLSEASAHLASFSVRIKEEPLLLHSNVARDGLVKSSWISSTAAKAAEAMLLTCPSAYEKRCLLQLLAAVDFGDGGSASAYFRRLYWKIDLAEPFLRKDEDAYLGTETLDDASLLAALEANGRWEQARNWAWQLESSGTSWKAAVHHVTEAQAEAMVVEWKEYLWDVPEERAALWGHCQTLFVRYSFPSLQAGLFFLKHAEAIEKEIPAKELHEMLLLSLQWLSGTMTKSSPVYPLHLLREIETRVWLLAVESEAQSKAEGDFILPNSVQNIVAGTSTSFIEQTACVITKMDAHINAMWSRPPERNMTRENNAPHSRYLQFGDSHSSVTATSSSRAKRRSKTYIQQRRPTEIAENTSDTDDYLNLPHNIRTSGEVSKDLQLLEGNTQIETSISGWEEKVRPAEVERAILSLLEFGQITAAKQLQLKLSPAYILPELIIVNAALKVADLSSSSSSGEINKSELDAEVLSVVQSLPAVSNSHIDLLQVLESLAAKCGQGCGYGFCWRIIAVVKAAKVLGLTFSEAFGKRPIELLQLLSLKAQESLEEAKLLVQTHSMSSPSIARILAESFLKGLLAAHRGGYMDSQREEGPAPLLWRFSDFLKWAELCPSEQEIGHALMRLVMTGQEIPHACEVELLILSHHFYKSSACLDGVDVLVTLAANRVESYVSEGDFSCLARLITGVSNFHALNFILNILIENGQLDLLLQKYSTADTGTATSEAVRGFRLSVLTSLKLFNPHDLDAFAMVYHHFDMKHETASLLEFRSMHHVHQWFSLRYRERQTEDLLDAMRYIIEAAEVYSSIDAGHKTYRACARASLLSLQIRIPDLHWLELSETNARRAFVEQSRFQEALIVAEAYDLNQPSEWAPVLWNLMLKPDLIEEFVAEFVMVLPLQPSMLLELARFYRAEVAARGDQSHFSVWLSPGGLPAEWVKHLGKSFRSLLKRTRDLRVRLQLATIATGFGDVVDSCSKVLDRVSENASPLILRRGHGGAYLPLM